MLVPLATALAIFALLSLPGWILAGGRGRSLPLWVAAGFASQFAVILLSALMARFSPVQLDTRCALALALALSCAALLLRRGEPWVWPGRPDAWLLAVPVLATLLAATITFFAVSGSERGLLVHAWFNADGFKHLGHTQSLLAMGMPARDIFGGGEPLAYYWLFYIVPASAAAWHGDAAAALIASGLVQTFAFWIVLGGLLRSAGAGPRLAAAILLIAWLSPTLDGILALVATGWDWMRVATDVNVENGLLSASRLFRSTLYIPQHQLMLAGLLSWGVLRAASSRPLRLLALAPLVAAGAVSTLFGVACLAVFAATQLLDQREGWIKRIGTIAVVGVLALAVPLVLGVVEGGSGLDSPIFDRESGPGPLQRLLLALPGIIVLYGASLLGLVGLWRAWREPTRAAQTDNSLIFATALTIVGIATLLALTLVENARLSMEMQLRVSLLPQVGLALGVAFLLGAHNRRPVPPIWGTMALPLLVMGMATPVIDTIWHMASAQRWTISVPADDLAVLQALNEEAPRDAQVLNYPELPFVSGGRDIWAPIFAGRTTPVSFRSTAWGEQERLLDAVAAFYAGSGPLPPGNYGYVYLSRSLHPQSFPALMAAMGADADWMRAQCRPDACIWQRR